MKFKYLLIISIVSGVIITLILGLISYPTNGLLGVEKWGYPFHWLSQVVYPGARVNVNWSNFIIDLLIWIIVSLFILKILEILIRNLKK